MRFMNTGTLNPATGVSVSHRGTAVLRRNLFMEASTPQPTVTDLTVNPGLSLKNVVVLGHNLY